MEITYHRNSLEGADAVAYREFLQRAHGAHYMQALGWRAVVPAAGLQHRYVLVREQGRVIGAAALLRGMRGPLRSPIAVIERGPVVHDVRDLDRVLPALLRVARWHGIDQLRIQPNFADAEATTAAAIANRHGFATVEDLDGPYTATLRVALAGVERANIFAGSERSETRRCARKAREGGVLVRRGTASDLPRLAALYAQMMTAQGGNDRSSAYFASFAPLLAAEQVALFCAEYQGELDCAVLVARHPEQVTLHLGATSQIKRNYKKMLLPIWAAAEWAYDLGARHLDLGGVPPPYDADTKRQRIAQFKFDFASTPVMLTPVMLSAPSPVGQAVRRVVTALRKRG
ncbi:MAG TPA: GNAT family N-acetyltransferase [Kofleriaceae bacterium]|nr:GNAT family N-acetyltransferase [Kofleriaceae bacterium]